MIMVESKANDVARHGDSLGGGSELYLPIADSAMGRRPGGVGCTSRDAHDPSVPFDFAQGRRYAATSPASLLRSGHEVDTSSFHSSGPEPSPSTTPPYGRLRAG